jgi:hypothetical protein
MEKNIDIKAVIGYSGNTVEGLVLHPDNEHLIYPLGSTIVVRHLLTRAQTFLRGHDNKITGNLIYINLVIKVSKNGKYLASGQRNFMGFKADVIIWDFESK